MKQAGCELVARDAVRWIDSALVCAEKDAVVKNLHASLVLMLILLGAVASDSALAGRGHSGFSGRSGQFGHSGSVARSGHPAHAPHPNHSGAFLAAPLLVAPWYNPFYYPFPDYYYTPPLPDSPTVYIEQGAAPPEQVQQPYYWYYCPDSKTYYPYVDDCPGGWQEVVPDTTPPS